MKKKLYQTPLGPICYWVDHGPRSARRTECAGGADHAAGCAAGSTTVPGVANTAVADTAPAFSPSPQLVFLPGLTADHRLFGKQVAYFKGKFPLLVWDAPGHAESRPFDLEFHLEDKARWLREILDVEGFDAPVIIGQSMGGYVGQMFAQLFPERLAGFIAVDTAPLQRSYVTAAEIYLLKRMEPVYRYYPWKALLKTGTEGVATTEYGRKLMKRIMLTYDGDQDYYARLSGNGFRILAEAMEADLPYAIPCPALLICGTEDHAGSCIRYNRAWHKKTVIPIAWIQGAGHNSNTDAPEEVNGLIEDFAGRLRDAPRTQGKVRVNGVDLYYEKRGSGQPLLMVHGNGEDHTIFNEAVEVLSKRFTCYCVDSRGHGQSTPVDVLHYEDMAQDMISFMKEMDLRDVVFYGFSDGGIVGLLTAAQTDRVSTLITSGANMTPEGVDLKLRLLFRAAYTVKKDPKIELMMKEPQITEDLLGTIKARTLILAGSRDLIVEEETRRIAAAIPGAQLQILEGEDHGSYIIHQTKVAELILEFCR